MLPAATWQYVSLAACGIVIFIGLSSHLWWSRARRFSFPPEGVWGALNTVIGSALALIVIEDATKYIWLTTILSIGGIQAWIAYKRDKKQRNGKRNDYIRRAIILYHQLHKLWQPIHNRIILNNQAMRFADKNDVTAMKAVQDERAAILIAKEEAVSVYRLDLSPEAYILPRDIEDEFGISASAVLDVIGDHLWNATFDDIEKIQNAILDILSRLHDE
jgi:hypothetical protein